MKPWRPLRPSCKSSPNLWARVEDIACFHLLGTETDSDEACAHTAWKSRAFQLPQGPRWPSGLRLIQATPDLLLDDRLHALRKACGEGAAALHSCQMVAAYRAVAKRLCEYVSRSHRILNGQVDTDASDRGHRMGCVADAQQTGPIPLPKAVCPDGQQLHIVPVSQFRHAISQERGDFHNARTEAFDASRLHLFRSSFGDSKAAMPIVSAINRHHGLATIGVEEQVGIVCMFGQPYLKRIHGSSNVSDRQARAVPNRGVPAIRAYDQVRANFYRAGGSLASNAANPAIFLEEPCDLGLHSHVERGIAAAVFGKEVQEVPLRHERHEAASRSKIRHITQDDRLAADTGMDLTDFLMRPLQKLFKQTQLVYRFKSGGMNRVAAEVSQEVSMLLQNQDVYSCADRKS